MLNESMTTEVRNLASFCVVWRCHSFDFLLSPELQCVTCC